MDRCLTIEIHFREDVSDDGTRLVFGYPGALRPGDQVVEVILKLVVLWKVVQVTVLHLKQIIYLYIHD